jgi:glycolate oxidase FAD binding subunit
VPADARLPLLEDAALLEWQGVQRWYHDCEGRDFRAIAAEACGSATLFRGAMGEEEVFAPLPAPVLRLHRSLKQVFDPAGILNRGRMYGGL